MIKNKEIKTVFFFKGEKIIQQISVIFCTAAHEFENYISFVVGLHDFVVVFFHRIIRKIAHSNSNGETRKRGA